jgi:hypothetical protein
MTYRCLNLHLRTLVPTEEKWKKRTLKKVELTY